MTELKMENTNIKLTCGYLRVYINEQILKRD